MDISHLNPVKTVIDNVGEVLSLEEFAERLGRSLDPNHLAILQRYGGPIEFELAVYHPSQGLSALLGDPPKLNIDLLFGLNDGEAGLIEAYNSYSDRLGKHIVPLADPGGGDLIVFNERDSQVYFWNHEAPGEEGSPASFSRISNSVADFLSELTIDEDDYVDPDGQTEGLLSVDLDF